VEATVEDFNNYREHYYKSAEAKLLGATMVYLIGIDGDWSCSNRPAIYHFKEEIILSFLALCKSVEYKIEKFTVGEIKENIRNGFPVYTEEILRKLTAWLFETD